MYAYALIGAAVVGAVGWFAGWYVPKMLDARFDRKEREDAEYRREQVEDAYRQARGQQVMGDCLHEVLRHMITGNHIDDLEKVQKELESFRAENASAILRKATKYNLR